MKHLLAAAAFLFVHLPLFSEQHHYEVRLFSICGEDTRKPGSMIPVVRASNSKKNEPVCTAWLAPSGHFVTAAHCLTGGLYFDIIETNVPDSKCDSTPVMSNSSDRFRILKDTIEVYLDLQNSFDFALFKPDAFDNQLLMKGDFFRISNQMITKDDEVVVSNAGFGIDHRFPGQCLSRNRTLQQAQGKAYHSTGWLMHNIDTHRGSSGSPIFQKSSEGLLWVYGIHRGGSCPNIATATNSKKFISAMSKLNGRTYIYVDSLGPKYKQTETGEVHKPYRSVTRAIQDAPPGSVINVAPGDYIADGIKNKSKPFTLKAPFGNIKIKSKSRE